MLGRAPTGYSDVVLNVSGMSLLVLALPCTKLRVSKSDAGIVHKLQRVVHNIRVAI